MPDTTLGVDVSKETLDASCSKGQQTRAKTFANTPDGWRAIVAWLKPAWAATKRIPEWKHGPSQPRYGTRAPSIPLSPCRPKCLLDSQHVTYRDTFRRIQPEAQSTTKAKWTPRCFALRRLSWVCLLGGQLQQMRVVPD